MSEGRAEVLAVEHIWGGDFAGFLAFPPDTAAPARLVDDLCLHLQSFIKKRLESVLGEAGKVYAGYAMAGPEGNGTAAGKLFASLLAARRAALSGCTAGVSPELLAAFKHLLETKGISVVYQPVVSLSSGDILGWEALARGPRDAYFRCPDVLFDFAEQAGRLFALEKLCREAAIRNVAPLGPGQKLFPNIHPRTICDPAFTRGETLKMAQAAGLDPAQVVFEITERHGISDFGQLNRVLEYYRSQGYLVAVDDTGTGFSSLQAVAELRPDFVKLDMSLVRGVDRDAVRLALVETLAAFADRVGSFIVAEGIETEGEMAALIRAGVHYGQGYYLARPAFPKPRVPADVVNRITGHARRQNRYLSRRAALAYELCQPATCVPPDTPVREVREMLAVNEPLFGVVVADGGTPVGLVMRHHLDRCLSSQYGVALYYSRPISSIMDRFPLVVDADAPVEVVADKAMRRKRDRLYDHIIVVRNGAVAGVISVRTLLDTMTRLQVGAASTSKIAAKLT